MRNNIKTIIENIHDVNFSGEFSGEDVVSLRLGLTEFTHYCELLNIDSTLEKSVFERELKKKYHALCLRFHPDCTIGNISKSEILKLINNAYEKLRDPDFRGRDYFSSCFFREPQPYKNTVFGKSLCTLGKNIWGIKENIIWDREFSVCGQYIVIGLRTYYTTKHWERMKQETIILDIRNNKLLHQLTHKNPIWNITFSADAKQIVFYESDDRDYKKKFVCVLTIETGQCIKLDVPSQMSLSPILGLRNGNVLSFNENNSMALWRDRTGGLIHTLKGHTENIVRCYMPNNHTLISASMDNTMKIWNMVTGECEHTLSGFDDARISVIALSPDGQYLVVGSHHGRLDIWDFNRKQLIKQFEGYKKGLEGDSNQCFLNEVLFSPDSRYFVSIANSPVVKIWEIESGKQVSEKTLPDYPAFSRGSAENILIGFDDGSIREFSFSDFGYECILRTSELRLKVR